MYLEDLYKVVSRIEKDNLESETYLESLRSIDSSICESIIENKYTGILYRQNNFFLKAILGKELFDWVEWYIYDSHLLEEDKPNVFIDNVGYVVKDLDSFMDFAQHGLCLKMRPKHENV